MPARKDAVQAKLGVEGSILGEASKLFYFFPVLYIYPLCVLYLYDVSCIAVLLKMFSIKVNFHLDLSSI